VAKHTKLLLIEKMLFAIVALVPDMVLHLILPDFFILVDVVVEVWGVRVPIFFIFEDVVVAVVEVWGRVRICFQSFFVFKNAVGEVWGGFGVDVRKGFGPFGLRVLARFKHCKKNHVKNSKSVSLSVSPSSRIDQIISKIPHPYPYIRLPPQPQSSYS